VRETLEEMLVFIEAQGDKALYLYLIATLVGVVALVPTSVMEIAGGFLFCKTYGLMTTWLLTCVAKLIANVISVWLARNVLRNWVIRTFVEKSELLTMVSKAVQEEPFKMAFLVRGSMVPLAVKNYGLGVLDIGYLPIACCACIFTPFYALQNIYVGNACQDLKEAFSPQKKVQTGGWANTLKSTAPIVFNLLLVLFLVRAIKKQIKKSKDQVEVGLAAKKGSDKLD